MKLLRNVVFLCEKVTCMREREKESEIEREREVVFRCRKWKKCQRAKLNNFKIAVLCRLMLRKCLCIRYRFFRLRIHCKNYSEI